MAFTPSTCSLGCTWCGSFCSVFSATSSFSCAATLALVDPSFLSQSSSTSCWGVWLSVRRNVHFMIDKWCSLLYRNSLYTFSIDNTICLQDVYILYIFLDNSALTSKSQLWCSHISTLPSRNLHSFSGSCIWWTQTAGTKLEVSLHFFFFIVLLYDSQNGKIASF